MSTLQAVVGVKERYGLLSGQVQTLWPIVSAQEMLGEPLWSLPQRAANLTERQPRLTPHAPSELVSSAGGLSVPLLPGAVQSHRS